MTTRSRAGSTRLFGVLALILSSPAMAGEEPEPQPLDGASFTWTGFYVGAQLGGLTNFADITDPLGPSIFSNPNIAPGPFAGVQAGYDYQSGNVVYGIEAEIAFPQTEGTSTCSSLSGSFINSNCKIGIDTLGALTGRIGLALGPDGRTLVYGKAGAAWYTGSLDLATNDSTTGDAGNPFATGSNGLSSWGWTLGAGAEYALPGNWSVKAEYDYANFGDQSVTLLPSAVIAGSGAVVGIVPARRGAVSSELHAFKLGLNYRFGVSAPPRGDLAHLSLKDDAAPALHRFGLDLGSRYWHSWGRHKYDLGLGTSDPVVSYSLVSRLTYDDVEASTGEMTARVSAPWSLFAKGLLGAGAIHNGHMNDEDFNIEGDSVARIPYTNTISSRVTGDIPSYGTIDIGYDVWRAPAHRVGAYVGYNYYRETMGAYGIEQIANPRGPFGSAEGGGFPPIGHAIIEQEATWQSLRLGAAGEFYLTPRLKLSGDAAWLPYTSVNATDTHFGGNTPVIASINPLNGHGVGTQLEAMLSYDVTDQLSIEVGARYWAMWTTDASFVRTFDAADEVVTPTSPPQHLKIETERVGVLVGATYKFY